jgi:hypothetical protein
MSETPGDKMLMVILTVFLLIVVFGSLIISLRAAF